MLLEILLGTYGAATAFNIIVPLIKKHDAKKKTIKMFEENGYDVDKHYINILFKKYDIYKNPNTRSKLFDEEKNYYTFLFIPILNLRNVLLNTKYLLGDYSDLYNRKYDDYFDIKSYTQDNTLKCLITDKVIKENPAKLERIKDVKEAEKILNKQNLTDIDILAAKYEKQETVKEETEEIVSKREITDYVQEVTLSNGETKYIFGYDKEKDEETDEKIVSMQKISSNVKMLTLSNGETKYLFDI